MVIGDTPLLRLRSIGREVPGITLLAKAEWFNPGGSVKDRAAAGIVAAAEKAGRLDKTRILLDASSGNTAIAYAMIAAAKGYKAKLCVPSNANPSVIRTLKAYGAEVVLTSPLESSDGAIREARRLEAAEPGRYFYADQYNNPANWQAHYASTGPEIWEQTGGEITHFVAGLGTTGTLMGTGRFLKERKPSVQAVAVQPDSPLHGLEGLKQMATSIVPGIYDDQFPDLQMEVKTEEAYAMVKRLAREEGLLAGISSGAALAASIKLAAAIKNGITPPLAFSPKGRPVEAAFSGQAGGGVIVMIFPDGGARYLDEEFWND